MKKKMQAAVILRNKTEKNTSPNGKEISKMICS
jgi:hypothetical protein